MASPTGLLLSVLNIANINAFMSRLENSIKQILSPQQVTTMEVGRFVYLLGHIAS